MHEKTKKLVKKKVPQDNKQKNVILAKERLDMEKKKARVLTEKALNERITTREPSLGVIGHSVKRRAMVATANMAANKALNKVSVAKDALKRVENNTRETTELNTHKFLKPEKKTRKNLTKRKVTTKKVVKK